MTVLNLGKRRLKNEIKVVEGNAVSADDRPLEVLYEQPGLCAWVGRKSEEGKILDATPFFIANESGSKLSSISAGVVLLIDIARDATVENRYNNYSFAMTSVDALSDYIEKTYGETTLKYVRQEYVNRVMSPVSTRFIAKRLARILRVNYLEAASKITTNGNRIRLSDPPTTLVNLRSGIKFGTMAGLAAWLGDCWLEAEVNLLRKHPELQDRSKYFEVVGAANESV